MGAFLMLLTVGLVGYAAYRIYQHQHKAQGGVYQPPLPAAGQPKRRLFDSPEPEQNNSVEPEQHEQRVWKIRLKDERIVEQWFTLVEGAEGKSAEFNRNVKKILVELAVPNLRLSQRDVSLGMWNRLLKGGRRFLVAENSYLRGYRIFIGARDYGHQLSVSWYLTLELGFLGKLLIAAAKNNFVAIFLFPIVLFAKILMGGRRYVVPETMNLFDTEELRGYITTVHGAAKTATADLMKSLDLDFTKVDTKSRGFFNLA